MKRMISATCWVMFLVTCFSATCTCEEKRTVTIKFATLLPKASADIYQRLESEVKKFDWEYDDNETFYVLEGQVTVLTTDGENVAFGKGDLVTFSKGVKCTWDVKEKIRKHYKFG